MPIKVIRRAKVAVKITKAMEEFNLLYMEQPVEGIDQMAEVTRRVDTPIMADESVWTPQDVIEIIQKKAADVISIYTTKPGGMFKAKKVAAVAEAAGLKCNVNGSVETGVGNAANVHLGGVDWRGDFRLRGAGVDTERERQGRHRGYLLSRRHYPRAFRICRRRCDRFVEAGTRHRARRRQIEAIPHFVNSQGAMNCAPTIPFDAHSENRNSRRRQRRLRRGGRSHAARVSSTTVRAFGKHDCEIGQARRDRVGRKRC